MEYTPFETSLTPMQAQQLNPLSLAFIGDTVFDLYIRQKLVLSGTNTHRMHIEAIGYVSARNQCSAFALIEPMLTEDELYVFKRGRNTKPATVPKNAPVMDYRIATGLEALVGYLYITGSLQRLTELMTVILHKNDDKGNE